MNMKAELRARFGNVATTAQIGSFSQEYLKRAWAGELVKIGRGKWDLTEENSVLDFGDTPVLKATTREERAEMIRQRFEVMSVLADGVIDSNIRALMIAGAAGVGKTFELERKLEAAKRDGQIESMESVKGSISAIGLYEMLYNNCEEGQVLMFDDCDAVFGDEEALNLLKGALDTSTRRVISWQKASRYLEEKDIPRQFEYRGQVVFITNLDPEKIIAKGGKLAPHMNALLSRCSFLDLGIHDTRSILIRVEQVLLESNLASNLGIDEDDTQAVIEWLNTNVDRLRTISIRSVVQLASYIKTSPDGWRDLAAITMLKSNLY